MEGGRDGGREGWREGGMEGERDGGRGMDRGETEVGYLSILHLAYSSQAHFQFLCKRNSLGIRRLRYIL